MCGFKRGQTILEKITIDEARNRGLLDADDDLTETSRRYGFFKKYNFRKGYDEVIIVAPGLW